MWLCGERGEREGGELRKSQGRTLPPVDDARARACASLVALRVEPLSHAAGNGRSLSRRYELDLPQREHNTLNS